MNQSDHPVGVLIQVVETAGRTRRQQVIRIGVPLPRSKVVEPSALYLCTAAAAPLPVQFSVLQRWPDTSIKWLLVNAQTPLAAGESLSLWLRERESNAVVTAASSLHVAVESSSVKIDTGVARFHMRLGGSVPFAEVAVGAQPVLDPDSCRLVLTDDSGQQHVPSIDKLSIAEQGPLRVTVLAEGYLMPGTAGKTLRLKLRCSFHADSARVTCEVLLHNPQAARHPGGLWDLGDAGSVRFKDVSLRIQPLLNVVRRQWRAIPQSEWINDEASSWVLYQDSSGGEHWNSDNHLHRHSSLAVKFRGYQVRSGSGKAEVVAEGARATPALWVQGDACWLAVGIENFWQNFPKALRWTGNQLHLALFPGECEVGFELQGGEQKRHTLYLEFGEHGQQPELLPEPVVVLDPQWIEKSGAVPYFVAAATDESAYYWQYVNSIVEGPNSFFAKREIVDEYGWRNFGDLYADHEAVKHEGPQPLVSHYNNQYDFIYGAAVQFLRTSDTRWWQLCVDAARHLIDIDIYHTDQDKAAFNGGMFWHTDHYKPAATCSHRTYSRHNGSAGYGGGPSNEHNYTTGLLHYYYVSGDADARDAILGLAEWVMAMDDGNLNVFALLDNSPTGLASKTVSADYHHPGRGAGNSINALLDAYALSGDRRYVLKAEQLVQRCIHPRDDIAALKLDEPEYRWSYLVFLQILGKYLDFKREWGELDYGYYYARDSLLHYAAWMFEHEIPYKQQLHKVEIPTETWPAHDVRKAHVLHLAAKYAPVEMQASYSARAHYFQQQCVQDLLSFKTAYLTRPQVILSVYGHIDSYFRIHGHETVPHVLHNYQFGAPQPFIAQRARLGGALRWKLDLLKDELARVAGMMLYRVCTRLRLLRD